MSGMAIRSGPRRQRIIGDSSVGCGLSRPGMALIPALHGRSALGHGNNWQRQRPWVRGPGFIRMRLPVPRDGMCGSRTGPRWGLGSRRAGHHSIIGMSVGCSHTPLRVSRVKHSVLGHCDCGCADVLPGLSGLPVRGVLSLTSRQLPVALGHAAVSKVGEAPNGLRMSRCAAHYPSHLMLTPRRTLRTEYDQLTLPFRSSAPLPILALESSLKYGCLQPYASTAFHRKWSEYSSQ